MPVPLFPERPAETHGFIRGAVSEHGLQPGAALHPEQPQVTRQPRKGLRLSLFRVTWVPSLLQPGHRLPAHLHVLYEQRELRCGADGPQEPARIRPALSRSALLCYHERQFASKPRVVTQFCPSDRTRRHPAAQGLHSGHLRTDRHQFHDRGVDEGPSHGSDITISTAPLASNVPIPAVWLSAAANVRIFMIIW